MVRDRISRLFPWGSPLFLIAILSMTGCLTNAEDRASHLATEELRLHDQMANDLAQPVTARSQSPVAQIEVPPPPVLTNQQSGSQELSVAPLNSDRVAALSPLPPAPNKDPVAEQPDYSVAAAIPPGQSTVPDAPPGQAAVPSAPVPVVPLTPVQAPVTILPPPTAPAQPSTTLLPPSTAVAVQAPATILPPLGAPQPSGQVPPGRLAGTQTPGAVEVTRIKAEESQAVLPPFSDLQVRVVATIGTTPIYEREVKEAAFKERMRLMRMGKRPQSVSEQKAQDKKIYEEELFKLVERELIIDEMTSKMKSKNQAMLKSLKQAASKAATERLKMMQKESKMEEEQFKEELVREGVTYSGLKRCFEREFIVDIYMNDLVKDKTASISFSDIREYYDSHQGDYQVEDRVKWQDLFIRLDRYPTREAARQKVEELSRRAQAGTTQDFSALVKEFDQGDSSGRNGYGFGEKADEIRPFELAELVMSLKKGAVEIYEMEYGFHLIRIADRTYKGTRPFDEKVQIEIRRKLVALLEERNYREQVTVLWKRANPQLFLDQP